MQPLPEAEELINRHHLLEMDLLDLSAVPAGSRTLSSKAAVAVMRVILGENQPSFSPSRRRAEENIQAIMREPMSDL